MARAGRCRWGGIFGVGVQPLMVPISITPRGRQGLLLSASSFLILPSKFCLPRKPAAPQNGIRAELFRQMRVSLSVPVAYTQKVENL